MRAIRAAAGDENVPIPGFPSRVRNLVVAGLGVALWGPQSPVRAPVLHIGGTSTYGLASSVLPHGSTSVTLRSHRRETVEIA